MTKRSKRTRSALAQAVHQQLSNDGLLDVRSATAAAGVSEATFYAHFASHDNAIAAALDLALVQIVGVAELHFGVDEIRRIGLEAHVGQLVIKSHAVFAAEGSVLRTSLARLSHHREIGEVYLRHEIRSHEHICAEIELAQAEGLITHGRPEPRATALLVLLQGINNPLLTRRELDHVVAERLVRSIVALLEPV